MPAVLGALCRIEGVEKRMSIRDRGTVARSERERQEGKKQDGTVNGGFAKEREEGTYERGGWVGLEEGEGCKRGASILGHF